MIDYFYIIIACDVQPERVQSFLAGERDSESSGRDERFQQVAHHVDLRLLVALRLAPQDRIIEQVELVGVELAAELDRLADIQPQTVTRRQHLEVVRRPYENAALNEYQLAGIMRCGLTVKANFHS